MVQHIRLAGTLTYGQTLVEACVERSVFPAVCVCAHAENMLYDV